MKYLYWNFASAYDPGELVISGVGVRENMPPVFVDRPEGTGDWLLMFFYDPVQIGFNGSVAEHGARTLALWGKGQGHFYGSAKKKWCHSWLHFHGDICPGFMKHCGMKEDCCCILHDPDILERNLIRIYEEISGHNSPEMLQLCWKMLFMELGRAGTVSGEKQVPENLMAVREYLLQKPENHDNIEQLAHRAGMSVPSFCAAFVQWFGISPGQCRLHARLDRACYYLRQHSYPVNEVASLVGYDDMYQFSRIFKKHLGVSPGKWCGKLKGDFRRKSVL